MKTTGTDTIMTGETIRSLEFDKIRQILRAFSLTPPGREGIMNLRPLASFAETVAALDEVTEMKALLDAKGAPPLGGTEDLREFLDALKAEGAWLLPEALLRVLSSVEAAHGCRALLRGAEGFPRLILRGESLADLAPLGRQIRRCIGARGEILDTASFELGDLRRDIRVLKGRIKRALEDLLARDDLAGVFQERIITERNGRYVVPVKADHRGRIKGFIHDESASGQTLYVEPVSVLERNNELQAALRAEKREEEKVLRDLSAGVRKESSRLLENQEVLGHLDLVLASARFSNACDGVAPVIVDRPMIEIRQARHPLLLLNADGTRRVNRVTAVDLLLGGENDTLVISGPNTGGKTVALKTMGLLVLMARAGLHIPCAPGSRLYLFAKIFADIGDEQSIEENLSTFSGHLKRIGRILDGADADSLVLLDEAGTGTDPAEGGALALALIDTLRMRGTRTVVTTHLNLVKGYAELQEGVGNAAVEFDEVTLAPTYRLHYGIPGASNAFTIARRLGFPEPLLDRAAGYLDRGEKEGLEILERLNRLRKEVEREKEEVRLLRNQARQEREKRRRLLEEVEGSRKEILEKARRRGEKIVSETERKVRIILDEARETPDDTRQRAQLSGKVKDLRRDLPPKEEAAVHRNPPPTEVLPKEILRIPSLGVEGEAVRVFEGEVEMDVRGKKVRLPFEALETLPQRKFAGSERGKKIVRGRVEREGFDPKLLLVGERVDEALVRLDRFLDDALLHDIRELEIVHGSGEGILRKVVREFLARHRGVTSFHAGDPARGGDNVTVVKLGA